MNRMMSGDGYFLALDKRTKIQTQYNERLNSQTFGNYFVRQMASMGKTTLIEWVQVNKGVRVKLQQCGFTRDCEDYKFIVVASSSCCKKLITHEPHFFGVGRILNSIGVAVLLPNQA
jgi:hypothetical protein